jgi:hypothetical protein
MGEIIMPPCPRCHQEIEEKAEYCVFCGYNLQDAQNSSSTSPDSQTLAQIKEIPHMIPPTYQVKAGYYIKEGWALLKQNMAGFIGFTLIWFFIHVLSYYFGNLGQLLVFVISTPLVAGMTIVSAKLRRGWATESNDFLAGFRYFLPLLLYSVVAGILITVGCIFLIIPGIYLAVSYTFACLLILDRKLDFWPAMELSRQTIQRQWFGMFGFLLLILLLNLAGALLLGLGLLFTAPWSVCAITVAYDDIFGLKADSY